MTLAGPKNRPHSHPRNLLASKFAPGCSYPKHLAVMVAHRSLRRRMAQRPSGVLVTDHTERSARIAKPWRWQRLAADRRPASKRRVVALVPARAFTALQFRNLSLDDGSASRPDIPCDRDVTRLVRRNFQMEATAVVRKLGARGEAGAGWGAAAVRNGRFGGRAGV
jgi:hypothetical protein